MLPAGPDPSRGGDGALTSELEAVEPIAADLRHKKDGLENGALKLIAGLLDIGLDDLVQREKQAEARRRRQAYAISTVMGVLAIAAGVGGVMAYLNGETVKSQALRLQENNETLTANKIEIEARNADLATQLRKNAALTTRITSVVGELSEVAEQDGTVPERLLFLSFGARLGISASALTTILDGTFGNIQTFKPNNYGGPMCIGMNYCARKFTVEQMRTDWSGVLPPESIERLAAVWHVKKPEPEGADWETADPGFAAVRRVLETVRHILIERRDAIRVYGRAQLPLFCQDVLGIWPEAELLPPDAFGALVYVVVFFGPMDAKAMADGVASGKYADIPTAIRAMGKTRAAMAPGNIGARIQQWSEEQAQMYEQGLKRAPLNAIGSGAKPG